VFGLTVRQIAAAFLVGEATIAQRIMRAKKKIATAGIPFGVPRPSTSRSGSTRYSPRST
jgi:RNA polymerase sigma-70 factor (ECF subfamily)